MSEQREQIERVRGRIGALVCEFARYWGTFDTFGIEALQKYIDDRTTAAPASPDRILRDLRQRGELDYVVVNRRQALYQFTKLPA